MQVGDKVQLSGTIRYIVESDDSVGVKLEGFGTITVPRALASQVEDFAGLDVTDEQARKLVASAGEPAAQMREQLYLAKSQLANIDEAKEKPHAVLVNLDLLRFLLAAARATAAPASTAVSKEPDLDNPETWRGLHDESPVQGEGGESVEQVPSPAAAASTPLLAWNRVEDELPTEAGDYFVIREHAELYTIAIAATSFHPKGVPGWYDKGFNYLYWIGPIEKPKELKMSLETGEIRWKIRK